MPKKTRKEKMLSQKRKHHQITPDLTVENTVKTTPSVTPVLKKEISAEAIHFRTDLTKSILLSSIILAAVIMLAYAQNIGILNISSFIYR
ncbi:MAG: hypothetical protein ACEQSA_03450 [Weeksellaceae bacterium]